MGYEVVELRTARRCQVVDVTSEVASAVEGMGIDSGMVIVYSPHTTAAVTINEGADPDVASDILDWLERAVPHHGPYRHGEGNSDAHIKTALIGPSELVVVEGRRLVLGTWQRIFFCEFDGPRARRLLVKALG
jgi:secondary thiamine-phosphate synthase enzyme